NVHVVARATELVVQFVVGVQPFAWHVFGDRMLGIANDDAKRMLSTVMAAAASRLVADHLAIFAHEDVGASLLVPAAPSAEAGHLVVLFPIAEGVVRGMDHDEPAAVLHVV